MMRWLLTVNWAFVGVLVLASALFFGVVVPDYKREVKASKARKPGDLYDECMWGETSRDPDEKLPPLWQSCLVGALIVGLFVGMAWWVKDDPVSPSIQAQEKLP